MPEIPVASVVVSRKYPPGNAPTPRARLIDESERSYAGWLEAIADKRAHYEIYAVRDGSRVEFHRGWSKATDAEQIAECFPDRCPNCVTEIESGKVRADGSHEIRWATCPPSFSDRRPDLACAACKNRVTGEIARRTVNWAREFGIPISRVTDAVWKLWRNEGGIGEESISSRS